MSDEAVEQGAASWAVTTVDKRKECIDRPVKTDGGGGGHRNGKENEKSHSGVKVKTVYDRFRDEYGIRVHA